MLTSSTNLGDVGEVMHLAKSGRLIVRLAPSSGVRPGELLVDSAGKKVGKVVELIGPVTAPYASVMPMTDRSSRLVGTKIFSGGFIEDRHGGSSRRQPQRQQGRNRKGSVRTGTRRKF